MVHSKHLGTADVLIGEVKKDDLSDPAEIYKKLFEREYGITRLRERLEGKRDVGIILNDRNRPTPSSLVMDHLMEGLGSFENVSRVHIATGTHKEPTEVELREILGANYDNLRKKVHIHVARDMEAHVHYGVTSRGTPLYFDRSLEGHDLYIFVNSVEPHYFAGFTGGRKSIIPGMASFKTTEMNHSHALSEGSRTLALKGNPVHEDMEEGARIFLEGKDHLSIQIVQGPGKIINDLRVGDIFTSFNEAVELARSRFCRPVKRRYEIVVSVARPPMDTTLYQAQKAIENGKLALKDGGVLVLVAECGGGIGQSTFWDLLTSSSDPEEVLNEIEKGYVLGYHKAAKIAGLSRRASIFMVSSMDKEELRNGRIEGFSDLDAAMERAFIKVGRDPHILLIPDGTVTVPMLEEDRT